MDKKLYSTWNIKKISAPVADKRNDNPPDTAEVAISRTSELFEINSANLYVPV